MEWSGQCWHRKSTRENQSVPRTLRSENRNNDSNNLRSGDDGITNNAQSTEIRGIHRVSTRHLVGTTTATDKSTLATNTRAHDIATSTAITSPNRTKTVTNFSSSPTTKRVITTTTTISNPNRKRNLFVKTGLALDPIQIDILAQVSSHCCELIESFSNISSQYFSNKELYILGLG